MLHCIERKTCCPDSVLRGEGGPLVVAAVLLAEVGRHEQNVSPELNKVLVTAAKLHLLRTDFSNKQRRGVGGGL